MQPDLGARIIEKAKELGATMAGIANIELLRNSPSHRIIKMKTGLEIEDFPGIKWPEDSKSALVIAVSHPEDKPELDWWDTNSSPGNSILIKINKELSIWLQEEFGIKTYKMPYSIERGGIYLKDTAVLAGLGCIGKNNLLITPELGSKVRLRGMLLSADLTPTGPIDYDPCEGCEMFCRKVCPQNAFLERVLFSSEIGLDKLPGRDGSFSRQKCMVQMYVDMERSNINFNQGVQYISDTEEMADTKNLVKYCRQCELSCPVGKM
ncbi:MAG: epoxyqueuosine reductase [Spirochaetes bacterium]|nr:MAG: epoxyqueuosine reductase [Spirochaetota bacterium]RKY01072.1 MAG: epoxyqueuosine reductase [Spirochaetota bacterium]